MTTDRPRRSRKTPRIYAISPSGSIGDRKRVERACDHLAQAGLATISEVFDGSPPYKANGCIAQAWSVAECLRLLLRLQKAAPAVYQRWHKLAAHRMSHPVIGDTAGICRISMASGDCKNVQSEAEKNIQTANADTDQGC